MRTSHPLRAPTMVVPMGVMMMVAPDPWPMAVIAMGVFISQLGNVSGEKPWAVNVGPVPTDGASSFASAFRQRHAPQPRA